MNIDQNSANQKRLVDGERMTLYEGYSDIPKFVQEQRDAEGKKFLSNFCLYLSVPCLNVPAQSHVQSFDFLQLLVERSDLCVPDIFLVSPRLELSHDTSMQTSLA